MLVGLCSEDVGLSLNEELFQQQLIDIDLTFNEDAESQSELAFQLFT